MSEPLPVLGDNTTLGNMDGVIGYSYTGLGNGVVVVIYWAGCSREYRNNPLIRMRQSVIPILVLVMGK